MESNLHIFLSGLQRSFSISSSNVSFQATVKYVNGLILRSICFGGRSWEQCHSGAECNSGEKSEKVASAHNSDCADDQF